MQTYLWLSLLAVSLGWGFNSVAGNRFTEGKCGEFQVRIRADGLVKAGFFDAPLDYLNPQSPLIPIFYWRKFGTDLTKPPILLIHGGVGADSSGYYEEFKQVIAQYNGDVVAIDNRNDGCSNYLDFNLAPQDYRVFNSRNVVKDLELLRAKLYSSNRRWKIFGQSRGSVIAHYYLEMYPEALDSMIVHGYGMRKKEEVEKYTLLRSFFGARASERFVKAYPDMESKLKRLRTYLDETGICIRTNYGLEYLPDNEREKICGSVIVDSLAGKLSSYEIWGMIAEEIRGMVNDRGEVNEVLLKINFEKNINSSVYTKYFQFILGTNAQDMASPNPALFADLEKDPYISSALISEGRFVSKGIYPIYLKRTGDHSLKAQADPLDFAKVVSFLEGYKKKNGFLFPLKVFFSEYDPIAGPEHFETERQQLGALAEFVHLKNSGHEGWATEPLVSQAIFSSK